MLSQLFDVGEQMRGGVALKARIESTGVWRAPSAVPLIEEHEAVGAGIKKPAVPGGTSRTRAAVQDEGWLPVWIATGLPVDAIAVIHLQEALLVGLDFRIQIGHDSPASRSSLCRTLSMSMRCTWLAVLAGANDDYTTSIASVDQINSQPSRQSESLFPRRQPVYHTSCYHRKWHRSQNLYETA